MIAGFLDRVPIITHVAAADHLGGGGRERGASGVSMRRLAEILTGLQPLFLMQSFQPAQLVLQLSSLSF